MQRGRSPQTDAASIATCGCIVFAFGLGIAFGLILAAILH